jgi:hypothetical protein
LFLIAIGAILFVGNLMGLAPTIPLAEGAGLSLMLVVVGIFFAVDKDKRVREEKEREKREDFEAED